MFSAQLREAGFLADSIKGGGVGFRLPRARSEC